MTQQHRPGVFGGVDTHKHTHVAAAVDGAGRVLGTAAFGADAAGYAELLGWLRGCGSVERVEVPPEEKVAYEVSGAQRFDAFANRRVAHNVDQSQADYTRDEFESLIAVLEERLKHATLLVTQGGLGSATPGGLDGFAAPLWAVSPAQTPQERRFYWTEYEVLWGESSLAQASEEDRPAAEAALESARGEHQAARDALFGGAAQ